MCVYKSNVKKRIVTNELEIVANRKCVFLCLTVFLCEIKVALLYENASKLNNSAIVL